MFKINYIVNDKIEKIYVFFGSNKISDGVNTVEPNQLYKIEPSNPLFKNIFSKEEQDNITKENIDVEIVEEYIHLDDSIDTIKKKIIGVFSNSIIYEEIYMFYIQNTMLNTSKIYKQLTQNKKKKITNECMINFLLNFVDLENKSPEQKDTYTIDDLLNLNIHGNKLLKKPLVHKMNTSMFQYYFNTNPYEHFVDDPYIEENISNMISTMNSNLLMDFGKLYNNNIYLVLGKDIISDETNELFINSYFPFLISKNIKNKNDFDKNKPSILEKQTINTQIFETNNLFYNIYKHDTQKQNKYLSKGIRSIKFTKFQNENIQMPLETIFKLIHSSKDVPIIQYIAGVKKEPLYRLYCDKYSKDGKKIPFFSKKKIIKIINSFSQSKSITYYIHAVENVYLRCEINSNGDIIVLLDVRDLLNVDNVNVLVKSYINPILEKIQIYLNQSGYNMNIFDSLYDTDIEINNINYLFDVEISKKINFSPYIGCISSVFNVISSKLENNILMKFKKVSNFNTMSSHEEIITKLINQSQSSFEIINNLKDNFNYNDTEATNIFNKFIDEKSIELDIHENRKLRVKEQPGFDIIIKHDKFTNNIIIDVNGINNILYLETIPIYIDTLLTLNNEEVPSDYLSDVEKLCKKKIKEKEITNDIVSNIEQPNKKAFVESSKLGDDDHDDLFDIMYNDDEDDDEDIIDENVDESEDDDDELPVFGGMDKNNELLGILEKQKTHKKKLKLVNTTILEKNIEGMPLSNPNYFFERMYARDPVLFLKAQEGNFNSYSRSCPSSVYRQPVVLTNKEKENIDKSHPGSYSTAVKYGSKPENENWYICPRYWCLKSNTSLTEKDIEEGVCGGRDAIIPASAKKVPKDKYIIEFKAKSEHIDSKGNYITHYPGFLPSSKHPKGFCVPCCFKKRQDDKIKECTSDKKINQNKKINESTERENYILSQDKFPLDDDRLGYLPITIQMFLQTDNTKCYSDKNQNIIKPNYPCLLRYGVEYNEKQSFLYCIASLISSEENKVSIKQLKQLIIQAVSVDKFINYNNGNLIQLFKPEKIDYTRPIESYYIINDKNNTSYSKSKFYKKLDTSNKLQIMMFKKILASYEMFQKYILDEKSIIDHTYLWDIICTPNENFFSDGVNLIIMEVANDDITNNVNVYCPTNHYSKTFFDINKNSFLIIKNENIYEPICLYEEAETRKIVKYFNFSDKKLLPNLKSFLLEIKNYFNNCKPLPSLPRVYKYKNNLILDDLITEVKKINGNILNYILNYNSKVIAVKIKIDDENIEGILPCYPSSISDKITNIRFIDDIDIWSSYDDTINFLEKVKSKNENILCKPHAKIIDDGLIVGIITETNQFIMIDEPTEIIDDDYETINQNNFIDIDKNILLTNEKSLRDEFVRNVKLETNFYNSFRNLVRTIINKIENHTIKQDLRNYIETNKNEYHVKLEKIIDIIKSLVKDHITFSLYDESIIEKINRISSCYNNNDCNDLFCFKTQDGNCQLNLPSKNLINNLDNEIVYFARISDELLRFNRIKSFIFEPDIYLSFTKIDYELSDDEIILLQSSILGKGYLDNLEPEITNTYINFNTFDTIQPDPNISQTYSNVIQNKQITNAEVKNIEEKITSQENTPSETVVKKISSVNICKSKQTDLDNKLARIFPTTYKNIEYERDIKCGMQMVIDILKINGINKQPNEIISQLIRIYSNKELNSYLPKIFEILSNEGKKEQILKIKNNIILLDDYIASEEYFITELDVLLLMTHFNLYVIIIENIKKKGDTTILNIIPNKYNPENKYVIVANYLYNDVPKFKIVSDSSIFITDFNLFYSIIRSNPSIEITINNKSIDEISNYNFINDYLNYNEKKKKKKLILVNK